MSLKIATSTILLTLYSQFLTLSGRSCLLLKKNPVQRRSNGSFVIQFDPEVKTEEGE